MGWSNGYVADVPYTSGYYRDMAPAHQALAALVAGVAPPDPSRPFRYLELGCGTGVSLATLAAANPQAKFVGVDFMPSHVAAARRLIAAAGLANIEVFEGSFEALAEGDGLGQFEFAAVHGVYTWVSPAAQQAIVRILNGALAPGGLVYFGYNNMAGFQDMIAGQKLLIEQARRHVGDSTSRMRAALELMLELHRAGARTFDTSMLPKELQGEGADPGKLPLAMLVYLAHEYLNEHWRPLFITDVARDLAEAKLEFVGRSHLLEVLPPLVLNDRQREVVADTADPVLLELQTDIIAPVAFRRDLFVRGGLRLSASRQAELMNAVQIVLAVTPEEFPMTLTVLNGKLDLDAKVYGPIIARIAGGPASVAELIELAKGVGARVSALEIIAVLVGCGAAAPVVRTDPDVGAIRRFNAAVVESYREQAALRFTLASGVTGAGFDAPLPQCLAYLLASGQAQSLAGFDLKPLEEIASGRQDFWRRLGMM